MPTRLLSLSECSATPALLAASCTSYRQRFKESSSVISSRPIGPVLRRIHTRVVKTRVLLTASVLLFAFGGLTQVYARDSELPNFHQVNAQVYRGGQPKAGGLEKLKAMGIRTILNLRGEDDHSRAEGDAAQRLGLRYYSISLPGFSNPNDDAVNPLLEFINALEN